MKKIAESLRWIFLIALGCAVVALGFCTAMTKLQEDGNAVALRAAGDPAGIVEKFLTPKGVLPQITAPFGRNAGVRREDCAQGLLAQPIVDLKFVGVHVTVGKGAEKLGGGADDPPGQGDSPQGEGGEKGRAVHTMTSL